jgi:hypothetical protein
MIEQKTQELMSNIGALLPLIVTGVLTAIGAIVIVSPCRARSPISPRV